MIVVDTNVIAYLWLPGNEDQMSKDLLKKDPEWFAPSLWRFEFKSVLIQYFRHNLIERHHLSFIMDEVFTVMNRNTLDASDELVVDLACSSICSTYDCEYIALAMSLNIPLVTNDKQILKAFPDVALSPKVYLTGN